MDSYHPAWIQVECVGEGKVLPWGLIFSLIVVAEMELMLIIQS